MFFEILTLAGVSKFLSFRSIYASSTKKFIQKSFFFHFYTLLGIPYNLYICMSKMIYMQSVFVSLELVFVFQTIKAERNS